MCFQLVCQAPSSCLFSTSTSCAKITATTHFCWPGRLDRLFNPAPPEAPLLHQCAFSALHSPSGDGGHFARVDVALPPQRTGRAPSQAAQRAFEFLRQRTVANSSLSPTRRPHSSSVSNAPTRGARIESAFIAPAPRCCASWRRPTSKTRLSCRRPRSIVFCAPAG